MTRLNSKCRAVAKRKKCIKIGGEDMLKPRRQPGFKRDFRLAHVLKGTLVTDANQTTDE